MDKDLLVVGMVGEAIEKLQRALNLFGNSLILDGFFGHDVYKAVVKFQVENDLKPTGIVDGITRKLLNLDSIHVDDVEYWYPQSIEKNKK